MVETKAPQIPEAAIEAAAVAMFDDFGPVAEVTEVGLEAARPYILADLRERLTSSGAIEAARLQVYPARPGLYPDEVARLVIEAALDTLPETDRG